MNSQLNFFAYSAGYLDAVSEQSPRRPDNEHYMSGYRDGIKAVGESKDKTPCQRVAHATTVDAAS